MNAQEKYLTKFPAVKTYVPKDVFDEVKQYCKNNGIPISQYIARIVIAEIEQLVDKRFNYATQELETLTLNSKKRKMQCTLKN
jgi:hypothetical protein